MQEKLVTLLAYCLAAIIIGGAIWIFTEDPETARINNQFISGAVIIAIIASIFLLIAN